MLKAFRHCERASPPTRDLGSDRPGRSFSSIGARRSGYEDIDWHRLDEARFAVQAAALLGKAAESRQGDLVLIASPRFLGLLRKELPEAVQGRTVAEIDKDLVHCGTDEIIEAIAAYPGSNL